MNRNLLRGRRAALAAPLLAVAALTVAPAAHAATLVVDPVSGQDTNAGTAQKPLRTLAKALSRAHAGDTVKLGAGTYSTASNGERYSDSFRDVFTPAGVTIQGTSSGGEPQTVLQGDSGQQAFTLRGGATLRDLAVRGFNIGLRATKGKQVLERVIFQQDGIAMQVVKGSNLTLTDGTIAPDDDSISSTGVVVEGQARFAWRGGSLLSDPRACHAGQTGVFAGGHAQVTLQGLTVRDGALRLIDLQRSARATVAATELHSSGGPDGCSPDSTLLVRDQSRLTLDGVTLAEDHGDGTAITSASDPGVVVRRTSITGFAFGVVVAAVRSDLGRSGDPGGNMFRSSVAGVAYVAAESGTLQAVGNTWSAATQGADAAGHYLGGTTVRGTDANARGANFMLNGAGLAIVL